MFTGGENMWDTSCKLESRVRNNWMTTRRKVRGQKTRQPYVHCVDVVCDCTLYLGVRTRTLVGMFVSIDTHIQTFDSPSLSCMKNKPDPKCTQITGQGAIHDEIRKVEHLTWRQPNTGTGSSTIACMTLCPWCGILISTSMSPYPIHLPPSWRLGPSVAIPEHSSGHHELVYHARS